VKDVSSFITFGTQNPEETDIHGHELIRHTWKMSPHYLVQCKPLIWLKLYCFPQNGWFWKQPMVMLYDISWIFSKHHHGNCWKWTSAL